MSRKSVFERIYNSKAWSNEDGSIPLSGPGSSLSNTVQIRNFLDDFVKNNKIGSILDLGCGDLTWIRHTETFNDINVKYIGVDIVESVVKENIARFPTRIFLCSDVVENDIPYSDVILIRDVIFHMKLIDISKVLEKLRGKYLIITSCRNDKNFDNIDNVYNYCEVNLRISPFNKTDFIDIVKEDKYNRDILVYKLKEDKHL